MTNHDLHQIIHSQLRDDVRLASTVVADAYGMADGVHTLDLVTGKNPRGINIRFHVRRQRGFFRVHGSGRVSGTTSMVSADASWMDGWHEIGRMLSNLRVAAERCAFEGDRLAVEIDANPHCF